MNYVYEPQYLLTGWVDDSGMSMDSWFDQDVAGAVIQLAVIEMLDVFLDPDTFFQPPPITVEVMPTLFLDPDDFFHPMRTAALNQTDQMLRNEVRRVR